MTHPNEELTRKGLAAFDTGDFQVLNDLFADDLLWHVGGRGPLAGDYKGKDEVFGFFAKTVELTGGTFHLDIHDVLANDTHVAVLATATAERDGKKLNDNGVQVLHVADGKVTESWLYPSDSYAADEFWS
jgi:ketosteroid isomerase-like protein